MNFLPGLFQADAEEQSSASVLGDALATSQQHYPIRISEEPSQQSPRATVSRLAAVFPRPRFVYTLFILRIGA